MKSDIKIYDKEPEGFSCKVEVAAIYVQRGDKILFLQIAENKMEKGSWGVPAGKLESQEDPLDAAKRELFEETGIVTESSNLQPLGKLYFCRPEMHYIYHLFGLQLNKDPSVFLSREHCSHAWVSKEEALALPLMVGAMEALEAYFKKR